MVDGDRHLLTNEFYHKQCFSQKVLLSRHNQHIPTVLPTVLCSNSSAQQLVPCA
jgi:hypothetical protein